MTSQRAAMRDVLRRTAAVHPNHMSRFLMVELQRHVERGGVAEVTFDWVSPQKLSLESCSRTLARYLHPIAVSIEARECWSQGQNRHVKFRIEPQRGEEP